MSLETLPTPKTRLRVLLNQARILTLVKLRSVEVTNTAITGPTVFVLDVDIVTHHFNIALHIRIPTIKATTNPRIPTVMSTVEPLPQHLCAI